MSDLDLGELEKRTGLRPVERPFQETPPGTREGDSLIELYDPTDPRGSQP